MMELTQEEMIQNQKLNTVLHAVTIVLLAKKEGIYKNWKMCLLLSVT